MSKETLGQRLARLRRSQRSEFSQAKAGKAVKKSRAMVGHYEQDRFEVPVAVLVRFAKLYHVSTDYLLGLSNDGKST